MTSANQSQELGLLDAHRDSPALLLALLGADAMRRLRAAHTNEGLSPRQFQILGLLHDNGPMPQGDLLADLEVAASVVVTLLNPLEKAGYVRRERDEGDRRRHVVQLTPEGETLLRSAARAQQAVEDEIFALLDDAQRQQLSKLLVMIRDGLTGGDPHCATTGSLENFEPSSD